jgi:tyrosine-protein phosphatase YwqE
MFFFRKKNTRTPDLSWLGTDIHAHLLPGIDDGAQDMDTSLELVRGLAALGYKKLVATPHVLWEIYPNTPEIIKATLSGLQAAAMQAGITVELNAAAEYFIDDHLIGLLDRKAPLLPLHNNLVLAEFSMATAPFDLQQIFFDMQLQGYQPVLAHPERYIYLARSKEVFDGLWDAGVYFQLNLLSLAGHYGRTVQELAFFLLENGYYHFAGTDLHSPRQLDALQKLAASDIMDQLKDYPFRNKELMG